MAIDWEGSELEEALWEATARLRWYRPPHGTDNDLVLQQMYERVTGERQWRPIPTLFDDNGAVMPKGPSGDCGQVGWMGGEFDR